MFEISTPKLFMNVVCGLRSQELGITFPSLGYHPFYFSACSQYTFTKSHWLGRPYLACILSCDTLTHFFSGNTVLIRRGIIMALHYFPLEFFFLLLLAIISCYVLLFRAATSVFTFCGPLWAPLQVSRSQPSPLLGRNLRLSPS